MALNAIAADPYIDSWLTTNSGKYVHIYASKEAALAGTAVSTWTGQTLPTYSDIQEVKSSSNCVYVATSGLASHYRLNSKGGVTRTLVRVEVESHLAHFSSPRARVKLLAQNSWTSDILAA